MKELANSRLFMLKYWKWMFVLFVAVLSSCKTTQQPVKQSLVLGENPKREFRGAWIQTAFQGEYKEMSVKEMRRSFIRKLDFLEKCGMNAIISKYVRKPMLFIVRNWNRGAVSIRENRAVLRKETSM